MPSPEPTLTLEVLRPTAPAQRQRLGQGRHVIGRESGDIVLGDPETSAVHAELEFQAGRVIVRDLGSRNGTWRDGERLPQFALYAGQSFYCGATEIRLVGIEGVDAPKPGQTAIGAHGPIDESMKTIPRAKAASPVATSAVDALELQRTSPKQSVGQPMGQRSGTQVPGGPVPPAQGPSSPTLPGPRESGPNLQTTPGYDPSQETIPGTDQPTASQQTVPGVGGEPSSETIPGAEAPNRPTRGNTEIPREAPQPELHEPTRARSTPGDFATPIPGTGTGTGPGPGPGPVANAVIKDPAALHRRAEGPTAPATPRRWPRLLGFAAVALMIVAAFGGIGWLVYQWMAGRDMDFADRIASRLPSDAIGFFAVSSLEDGLELWSDDAAPKLREHAQKALGFDPLDTEAWDEMGVDPDGALGFAVLSQSEGTVAAIVPVSDREAFAGALRGRFLQAIDATQAEWVERSFGEAEGLWLEAPVTIAVVWHDEHAWLVTSTRGERSTAIERAAEALAKVSADDSMVSRPGFEALTAPRGNTLWLAYVDGAALREALPSGDVEGIAARMALADVEGLALSLSAKDSEVHLTLQTMLREGSRPLELMADAKRNAGALQTLPPGLVAGIEAAFTPRSVDRALSGAASLGGGSLALWEQMVKDKLGIALREDLAENLGGTAGAALLHLPEKPDGSDLQAVAWISIADPGKAKVALDRVLTRARDELGIEIRTEGDLEVHQLEGPPRLAWFLRDDVVWFAVGEVELSKLFAQREAADDEAPHEAIEDVIESRAPVAGFVDVATVLAQVEQTLPDSKAQLEFLHPLTSLLPAVTVQTEVKRNALVTVLTLHTTEDEGLAALVQGAGKIWGSRVADAMAAEQRAAKCQKLVLHVTKLTSEALEQTGKELPNAWELERRVLEECSAPSMSESRIECYLQAKGVQELQACDHAEARKKEDSKLDPIPTDVEPKAVPYVDDIWPNTADDADSKLAAPEVNYAVGAGEDPPTRGPDDALVTIVEFGDFQCQYCRRVTSTLDEVLAEHGQDVRLVFRHRPLPQIHPNAEAAAKAAIAAGEQGKFWQMHDMLFENPSSLDQEGVRALAERLGLDLTAFDRDFHATDTQRRLERDLEAAKRFAVTGTPVFFVNGRYLPGAQSKAAFSALIEEEKKRAETFVERRGGTRVRLYEDMIEHFAPEVTQPSEPSIALDPGGRRYRVSTTGLPSKGTDGLARVQVVECGDFDCPYCARATKTVQDLLDAYPTQVTFYFAHHPLPHHGGAEPAARAAVAAQEQDKFWEMHDALFENSDARSDRELLRLARDLGLDVSKFEEDLGSVATSKEVQRQKKLCTDNEATGTPTFFINGRKIAGAQSLERFKAMVDTELASGI